MLNFCENHLICQGNTYQNLEKQRIFANKSKRQTVWSKGEKGVKNGQSSFFSFSETKMNEMPVLRKNMAIVASLSAEKFLQKNKVLILNELGLFKLSKFSDARLMPSLCYFENPIQTRFTIIKNAIKKPIIAPKEPISNRPAIVLTTTKTNPPIPIIAGMDLLSFLPYNSNFACQGFC